ncbi:Arylphorin subunit C223 [Lucilia cuprina]|nr:Arylphorin subunit C223 [Lucilia cuprina]
MVCLVTYMERLLTALVENSRILHFNTIEYDTSLQLVYLPMVLVTSTRKRTTTKLRATAKFDYYYKVNGLLQPFDEIITKGVYAYVYDGQDHDLQAKT